jgi:hypothetical protein
MATDIVFGPNRVIGSVGCGFVFLVGALTLSYSVALLWAGKGFIVAVPLMIVGILIVTWELRAFRGLLRGLPSVTVSDFGVVITTVFDVEWAEWSSLTDFVLGYEIHAKGIVQQARSTIVGTGVSRNLRKKKEFIITAQYVPSLDIMVAELNKRRPPGWANDLAASKPNRAPLWDDLRLRRFDAKPTSPRVLLALWGFAAFLFVLSLVLRHRH